MSGDGRHQAGMTHLKMTHLLTFQGFSSIGDVKFEAITAGTGSQRCASTWKWRWWGGRVKTMKRIIRILVTEHVSVTMSVDWDQSQPSMKKVAVCVIQTLSNVKHPVSTDRFKLPEQSSNLGLHLARRGCPPACLLKDQFGTVWIFIFKFSQLPNCHDCCGFGYTCRNKYLCEGFWEETVSVHNKWVSM